MERYLVSGGSSVVRLRKVKSYWIVVACFYDAVVGVRFYGRCGTGEVFVCDFRHCVHVAGLWISRSHKMVSYIYLYGMTYYDNGKQITNLLHLDVLV